MDPQVGGGEIEEVAEKRSAFCFAPFLLVNGWADREILVFASDRGFPLFVYYLYDFLFPFCFRIWISVINFLSLCCVSCQPMAGGRFTQRNFFSINGWYVVY
jgi:hypothetical protein